MIEVHPFGTFVPQNSRHLLLGTFAGKAAAGYDWFYANGRNQFWPILQEVYDIDFDTKIKKQRLFERLKTAIADIILSCERKNGSNLDTNLTNIVFNTKAIENIFLENNIEKIFFTGRFAEQLFKRQFREVIKQYSETKLVALPSPSPRYAAMSRIEKVNRYKELLPKLRHSCGFKNNLLEYKA